MRPEAAFGLFRMRHGVRPARFVVEAARGDRHAVRLAWRGGESEAIRRGGHGGGEVVLGAGEGLGLGVEVARLDVGAQDKRDGLAVAERLVIVRRQRFAADVQVEAVAVAEQRGREGDGDGRHAENGVRKRQTAAVPPGSARRCPAAAIEGVGGDASAPRRGSG